MAYLFIGVYLVAAVLAVCVNLLEFRNARRVYRDIVADRVNGVKQITSLYFIKEDAFRLAISSLMLVIVLVSVSMINTKVIFPPDAIGRVHAIRLCHFAMTVLLGLKAVYARSHRLRLIRMLDAES